jgi:NAD(P)-dependent dehydrogenase (short-subunit alcohol dehydrogenase family)
MARRGAEVILCDEDARGLRDIARATGAFARFCDVASEACVEIFVREVHDRFGSIHVLVNAAGPGFVRSLGMMRMSHALMPAMRSAGGPRLIVNVAPAPGLGEATGLFPYAASDSAFARLSEAIALETRGSAIRTVTVVHGHASASRAERSFAAGRTAEALVVAEVEPHAVAGRIAGLAGDCFSSRDTTPQRSSRSGRG